MGASNAIAAYVKYAGKVPPKSLNVLVYMALVSKDSDERPWYGAGHAALAAHALGRPEPVTPADIQAVERAVRPLLGDALIVDRKAAVRIDGPNTVRYRLNLLGSTHARQKVTDVKGVEDPPRPSQSDPHARHFSTARPSQSDPHARQKVTDRGDKRNQEELSEEKLVDLDTELTLEHGQLLDRQKPMSSDPLPTKCPHGLPARLLLDGSSSCALCRRESRPDPTNVIQFRRPA